MISVVYIDDGVLGSLLDGERDATGSPKQSITCNVDCTIENFVYTVVGRKEGNVLFNDTLNTFYLRYMASDIW